MGTWTLRAVWMQLNKLSMSTCQVCLSSTLAINRMAIKIQATHSGQIGFKHRAGFIYRKWKQHSNLLQTDSFCIWPDVQWMYEDQVSLSDRKRGRHWPRPLLLDQFFSSSASASFLIGVVAVAWRDTNARQIECGLSHSVSLSLPPYLQFSAAQWVIKLVCSPVWNNFTAAEICPNVPACTDDWRSESTGMAKTGEAFQKAIWHSLLMNDVQHCRQLTAVFTNWLKRTATSLDICWEGKVS